MQSAYEIKVSDENKKQVWTSGKVNLSQSVFVPYAGPALASGAKYTVQVRVWDNNNKASELGGRLVANGALRNIGLEGKVDHVDRSGRFYISTEPIIPQGIQINKEDRLGNRIHYIPGIVRGVHQRQTRWRFLSHSQAGPATTNVFNISSTM